jgi:phosphoribosylformylglycinamidine synthase
MIFTAQITIMPLKELLDPQGKAVQESLHTMHLDGIQDVRIGKHITLHLEANSREEAESIARTACEKMLYHAVMETYKISIEG